MPRPDVRIVTLPDMYVASSYAFGTSPEEAAWEPIRRFAGGLGLGSASRPYRTFGFDNPGPSPGSPEYGYEVWMPIDPRTEVPRPMKAKDVEGGRFAVWRVVGLRHISEGWRHLVAWVEDSPLEWLSERSEALEELLNPDEPDPDRWVFDLYVPIRGGGGDAE